MFGDQFCKLSLMLLPWDQLLSPAEARPHLNNLLADILQWLTWHISSLVSMGSGEKWNLMPTEQQRAGLQLGCRHCVPVCSPALLQPLGLTGNLGFSCLDGNAGLSEIHPFTCIKWEGGTERCFKIPEWLFLFDLIKHVRGCYKQKNVLFKHIQFVWVHWAYKNK